MWRSSDPPWIVSRRDPLGLGLVDVQDVGQVVLRRQRVEPEQPCVVARWGADGETPQRSRPSAAPCQRPTKSR